MRSVLVAVLVMSSIGGVEAHPGGTDRFGCHVESKSGTRHCHNGDSEGGGVPPVFAAQAGGELGGSWRSQDGEEVSLFGSAYTQHDGSMLFLANVGGHIPKRRGVTCYADLGIGAAWLARTDVFFALQFAIGVKVPFVYMNDAYRSPYLKIGAFGALIDDGNPAETIGVTAALGFTL